ncbi:MAG: hypothetical protein Q8M99_07490 [Methylotenera sp.]|nr:hypothetical protein [Methylotenera sp.]
MIKHLKKSYLGAGISSSRISRACISAIHKKKNKAQKGVVLFFALIALVVMSLAAAGLIRSVDTNSLIAGNLSFKQSSMLSADRGVETAMDWVLNNSSQLGADKAANGYFATSIADARELVDASGVVDTADDGLGNNITYVVQRMCRTAGFATADIKKHCLFGPLTKPADNQGVNDPNYPTGKAASLIYRVTARVVGPKNTVSYIQTFVY